jgi:NAD(P)-dependent dehydrogenase (short-subunit alcohol dehydrogenase family)
MSWTTQDIPGQTGRVAVVTGANGGLGLETTRALAMAGSHVIMAVRDEEKAAAAITDIQSSGAADGSVEPVRLDLGSQASVREAAGQILAAHEAVDMLINNAGVMGIPERRTGDGFEMQFGVNHLGHYSLTALLMPLLLRAPAARVVTVTSTGRHFGRAVDPANPHLRGRYGPWRAYDQSKLANFHFGIGLERRLEQAGAPAISLVAHPGLSNTDLQAVSVRETGGGLSQRFFLGLASSTGMTAARGALPQLRAATDPSARGGELYAPRFGNSGPPVRRPILRRIGMDRAIEQLWEVSERETGLRIDPASATTRAPGQTDAGMASNP